MMTYGTDGMPSGGVVVVTGARDMVVDAGSHLDLFRGALRRANPLHVFHGGARGADSCVEYFCRARGIPETAVYPKPGSNYRELAENLLARNLHMLDLAQEYADLKTDGLLVVLAFQTPNTRGTWYTARHADARGIPTYVVRLPAPEGGDAA